jgi:hypothetical protein
MTFNKRAELVGEKFGRLTVIEFKEIKNEKAYWLCKCECGNPVFVPTYRLKGGITQSCGCLQKERTSDAKFIHGQIKSSEYSSWVNMKNRCLNPKTIGYSAYGGRGIKVCKRWRNSFEEFFKDMGSKPTPRHTLDRKNPDGNYEPNNCRWATEEEQQNNRRNNRVIEYKGESLTVSQLARKYNQNPQLVLERVNKGWSIERALTKPAIRLYDVAGELLSVPQCARKFNIKRRTLHLRIERGLGILDAIALGIIDRDKEVRNAPIH